MTYTNKFEMQCFLLKSVSLKGILFFLILPKSGDPNPQALAHYQAVAYLEQGCVSGWLAHTHMCIAQFAHVADQFPSSHSRQTAKL